MKLKLISAFIIILCVLATGQNTIGITKYEETSLGGYTFFSPFSGTRAYLVDRCGRLVNAWDRDTRPGLSAYLLNTGQLLRTFKTSPQGPFTSASNAGGLELVDWDNQTVWQYEINTPNRLSHHDAVYMPNGNILVLTWELVFAEELIALGRDPSQIAIEGYMWSETILELRPTEHDSAVTVWEWRLKDHYIQDFDPSKSNFGTIADHPELFDINLPDLNSSNSNATRDWNHFNSIDYHPQLDQILVSTRNSDEIWIIDHSTTTEEARGHSGGRAGQGGDIIYRWGNASAYRAQPTTEQQLFGQHGAQWIVDQGTPTTDIILFNNGNGRFDQNKSTVEIVRPPMQEEDRYLPPSPDFGPKRAEVLYGNQNGEEFYAPFLSNAQYLPGGHILVNAGTAGRIFELSPARKIIWEYIIPLAGDIPIQQGAEPSNNWSFRVYRYLEDFEGFHGLNLVAHFPIEIDPDLGLCQTTSSDPAKYAHYEIFKLGQNGRVLLEKGSPQPWQIKIWNTIGQLIISQQFERELDIILPSDGIYYLLIRDHKSTVGSHKFMAIR